MRTDVPQPTASRSAPICVATPQKFLRRRSCFALMIFALIACAAGCGAISPTPTIATRGGRKAGERIDAEPQPQRIAALTQELREISPNISPDEAADCADCAVRYTALMAESYHLTRSAEFNSFLVNIGVHRRGKCYQLAEDLKAELVEQHYQTIVFTRGVAYWDDLLREHNCIVATAPGQPFDQGLVLDAWRNPGTLRWARVKLDEYPWIPRIVTPAAMQPVTASVSVAPAR